jgi:prepilin-type N-terminal cleavage/methylation domain-containing protein
MKSSFLTHRLRQAATRPAPITSSSASQTSGYTLIELLVVVVIIAILSAIIAPSYVTWINNQRVGAARSQIADAMRKAQNEAKRTKLNRELRIDNNNGQPRYAIVPTRDGTNGIPNRIADSGVKWQSLSVDGGNNQGLQIRASKSPLSSPNAPDVAGTGGFVKAGIVFDPYGTVRVTDGDTTSFEGGTNATPPVFTVQITIKDEKLHKRCVVVRTLLGGLREDKGTKCPALP